MRDSQEANLQERRAELSKAAEALRAQDPDGPELRELDALVQQIDALAARSPAAEDNSGTVKKHHTEGELIATVPKTPRAELRVYLKKWKGRQIVDLRLYCIPDGQQEHRPTRKGVAFDARKLPELVAALSAAATRSAQGT